MITAKKNNYFILDEESNALDYLVQSSLFLNQAVENRTYWKWFVIAFHGAIHSYMLLVLHKIDPEQIYRDKKVKAHSPDRKLLDFLSTYELLKKPENMKGNPFSGSRDHDTRMIILNNEIRNLFMHFRPMVWAAEPWYFVSACKTLLDVLKFCAKNSQFRHTQIANVLSYIDCISITLYKIKEKA